MIIVQSGTFLLQELIKPTDSEIQITVEPGVQVTLIDKRMNESHVPLITLIAERNSSVRYEALAVGADEEIIRIKAVLNGLQADVQLRIGSITKKEQRHTIETEQLHLAEQTTSSCIVRSICHDQSRSQYQGMIVIEKEGQKSEAHQDHKALLLGDNARAYARPSLQIRADDVQCGHGSAIGQLDADQSFYLETRGIRSSQSQAVLSYAFLSDLYKHPVLQRAIQNVFEVKIS